MSIPEWFNKVLGNITGTTSVYHARDESGTMRRVSPEEWQKIQGGKKQAATRIPEPVAPVAPVAPPPQTPQVQGESSWSAQGRPATNPYSDIISQVFGNKAANMEKVLRWGEPGPGTQYGDQYGGENLSYNARGENQNPNGSIDRGLYQINSDTFDDFVRRKGDIMRQLGITSFDDMFDPQKNALMARLIQEEQGYGAWYGAPEGL